MGEFVVCAEDSVAGDVIVDCRRREIEGRERRQFEGERERDASLREREILGVNVCRMLESFIYAENVWCVACYIGATHMINVRRMLCRCDAH